MNDTVRNDVEDMKRGSEVETGTEIGVEIVLGKDLRIVMSEGIGQEIGDMIAKTRILGDMSVMIEKGHDMREGVTSGMRTDQGEREAEEMMSIVKNETHDPE